MSVVHPALLVPEILDNILSSLGKTSQAHAARVCHLWWEAAISLIWHTLDDWHHLFRIAGPLHIAARRPDELTAVSPAFFTWLQLIFSLGLQNQPLHFPTWLRSDANILPEN